MLTGVITHVGVHFGVLVSSDTTYQFVLLDFPNAEVGQQVAFKADEQASTLNSYYAKDLEYIAHSDSIVRDLLRRVDRLEEEVTTLRSELLPLSPPLKLQG